MRLLRLKTQLQYFKDTTLPASHLRFALMAVSAQYNMMRSYRSHRHNRFGSMLQAFLIAVILALGWEGKGKHENELLIEAPLGSHGLLAHELAFNDQIILDGVFLQELQLLNEACLPFQTNVKRKT